MKTSDKQVGLWTRDSETEFGLASAHVSGRLSGLVAQIKVRQVYRNWTNKNLECTYTFPLAWQSVLLGMHVELNGKRLTGTVKPKKAAELEYEKAIDNGDLPVMLERAGRDLYTANIGNIQSGDEVVIELEYAQLLKIEDGAIRFSLPTTIAPRYGDSSQAGVQLHQQSTADPQAEHRLFLNLELSTGLTSGMVYSPTHEVEKSLHPNGSTVKLVGAAWLDRDFVLVVDRVAHKNLTIAGRDPVRRGEVTLLTSTVFKAPKSNQIRPISLKILVDCSGSMQGDSIRQAQDCLNWLIGQLTSADQISFSRFGSTVEHDHPTLQSCSSIYKQALKSSIRGLRADLGGTEIEDAFREVVTLESSLEEGSGAIVLLITDGEVWNIDQTIATVRASGHRVYAVGVGSAPAESLLREVAEISGGACEMVTPQESMQKAVERLIIKARNAHPVPDGIECSLPVHWRSRTSNHAVDGENLNTWLQAIEREASGDIEIQVNDGAGTPSSVHSAQWENDIALSRIAAAFRLRDICNAKEREEIAIDYQLVTNETNFILVHERAETEKAEDLPELHQVQPMLAAGWSGNGSVAVVRRAPPPLQVMRSGCDNVPFSISESRSGLGGIPAVWRTARTHAAARVDGMSSAGMDDIEIPAFLRKQADGGGLISTKSAETTDQPTEFLQKESFDSGKSAAEHDALQHNAPTSSLLTRKPQTPQASPEELKTLLRDWPTHDNPVMDLVICFNRSALTHNQFRSALAACLRTNQAGFLQWLVTKHMKAAGSAAPVWAVFMNWAAERFSIPLDRHADRVLRDFLRSMKPGVLEAIRADLDALTHDLTT